MKRGIDFPVYQPAIAAPRPSRVLKMRPIGVGGIITGLWPLSAASKILFSISADCIPVRRIISLPPENPSTVGMLITPRCLKTSGESSALSLRISTLPWYFSLACLKAGCMARQGAHQGAHRSTINGFLLYLMRLWNSAFFTCSSQIIRGHFFSVPGRKRWNYGYLISY